MTFTITRRTIVTAVLVLLAVAGAGYAGYRTGQSNVDVEKARKEALAKGNAAGFNEGSKSEFRFRAEQIDEATRETFVNAMGYSDWKPDRWYAVYVVKIARDVNKSVPYAIDERQIMQTGLRYSVCGDDGESVCYEGE